MAWLFCGCLAVPFLLSATGTLVLRRRAVQWGFVDRPGGHKQHADAMPLGGGIAITLSLLVPLLAVLLAAWLFRTSGQPSWLPELVRVHLDGIAEQTPTALAVLGGVVIFHVTGLIDDVRPLTVMPKLLVSIVVASILVVVFEIRAATHLGPVVSSVITVLWIVGITHAFNLMDNTDGLCGGVACIAGLIFAVSAVRTGQIFVPAVTCMLVGAVAGFLWLNFPPASIFMGDSGSLVVGYMLAVLTVLTTFVDPAFGAKPYGMLAPIVILAVPIYDTASVVWLRWRSGAKLLAGDRRHFSHRLLQRGMSPRAAVLTIYLATFTTGLWAMPLSRADWTEALLAIVQCLAVVLIIAILEKAPRHDPTR